MQLEQQENTAGPLFTSFVRDGVPGNYDVVFQMVRIIRDSVNYDRGIETLAKQILIDKNLDSYSRPAQQLEAIFNFVKGHVAYIEDKAGLIESLKSARVTLADGYGDCDDHTNTNATLAACIGFEKVCVAMARYMQSDTSFVHVYCVVYDDKNNRYVLDTTLPHGEFNDEVNAIEVKEISVFDEVQGLDGISGLFNNTKHHAKKMGKALIETMPLATNFLPLGFLSGQAFSTGAQLISQSNNVELSLPALASKINHELDAIIGQLIQSNIAYDLAKAQALRLASQIGTIENNRDEVNTYKTVTQSVKTRLDFIKNFKAWALEHDIHVVELNPHLMLMTGLAGAGVGGYLLWRLYKGR